MISCLFGIVDCFCDSYAGFFVFGVRDPFLPPCLVLLGLSEVCVVSGGSQVIIFKVCLVLQSCCHFLHLLNYELRYKVSCE